MFERILLLNGMSDELTKIAVNLPPAPYSGGVKNFMRDSISRGWNTQGSFGKGIMGLTTGVGVSNALKAEDPSGEDKSRPERLSQVAGGVGGSLLGSGVGYNVGNMITRKLDPNDKYLTNIEHTLDNHKFSPLKNSAGEIRNINGVMMDSSGVKQLAERKLNKAVNQSSGKFLAKGNAGNYLKFRGARAGLSAIPGVLGMAGGVLGMGLGEKLMSLPFRKKVNQQQPSDPQVVANQVTA